VLHVPEWASKITTPGSPRAMNFVTQLFVHVGGRKASSRRRLGNWEDQNAAGSSERDEARLQLLAVPFFALDRAQKALFPRVFAAKPAAIWCAHARTRDRLSERSAERGSWRRWH
jgi:hypothetical protein